MGEDGSPSSVSMTGAPLAAADVRAMLMQAVAAHRQGRLAVARAGYEEILRLHPAHFDALHLLGVIALQQREAPRGVDLIRRAIDVNPRDATAHLNLARGLSDLRSMDEALNQLDRAIALKPDYAEAFANRGHVLAALKRPIEALASCDRAIALGPGLAQAHNNRSNALLALGRAAEALQSADRALALNPDYPEARNNRGIALETLDRPGEALASYDRAVALKPDYTEAHFKRANSLQTLGRLAEAVTSFDRAIALDPDNAVACNNRGSALQSLGRLTEACSDFERAIALDPRFAKACSNLGNVLCELGRVDEGLSLYDRAIELNPDLAEAHSNRGNALQDLMRHDEALASLARAVALKPDFASAYWNESLTRLLLGDFEAGWKLYEWRWRVDVPNWPAAIPRWHGEEPLGGKTIVLHAEQGLGDAIQFCRYAKRVAARGATVLLQVRPALAALLRNVEGVSRVAAGGERLSPHDFHCPLLSLPLAFKTRLETIPTDIPYLLADPKRVGRWHERLGAAPRVGVVWAGSATHKNDRNRSIALAEMLRAIPAGLRCWSLQRELRDGDRELLRQRPEIIHLGDELADLTDTAALLSQLDLVISVDTAVVHLAGALGRPVWVLLPFAPDWRWLLDRDDSPWYPTARLFRQTAIGDWASVLSRVRDELTATVLR